MLRKPSKSALAFIFLFLLVISCKIPSHQKAASQSGVEAVFKITFLAALYDWPEETREKREELRLKPEEILLRIQALQPEWDAAVEKERLQGEKHLAQLKDKLRSCDKTCDCHFYMTVIESSKHLKKVMPREVIRRPQNWAQNRVAKTWWPCLMSNPQAKTINNDL